MKLLTTIVIALTLGSPVSSITGFGPRGEESASQGWLLQKKTAGGKGGKGGKGTLARATMGHEREGGVPFKQMNDLPSSVRETKSGRVCGCLERKTAIIDGVIILGIVQIGFSCLALWMSVMITDSGTDSAMAAFQIVFLNLIVSIITSISALIGVCTYQVNLIFPRVFHSTGKVQC